MKPESVETRLAEPKTINDESCACRRLVTVKEAAQRLGKSVSTVYRLHRLDGPFGFLDNGRRVFIDAESFEIYLAELVGTHAEDGLCGVECSQPTQPDLAQEIPALENAGIVIEKPTTVTPSIPLPLSKSGGQREGVARPRAVTGMFQYQSFVE